ncbi:hypothetical protein ABPG74_016523 [Tetrahymena malaccensis]
MIKQDQIIQGANDSYKILEVIGTGNISLVFKAINLKTYEYVAIKVISKIRLGDQKDNLYYEREIKILKKLMKDENQHQNIIKIFDIFEFNNQYFVVFELLKDGNLIEYLMKQNMQIDEKEAIDIILQVTKAICHLHKLQIMHRDIKPENILLQIAGDKITAKIIDFGVSSQNENSLAFSQVGSISYISKEILLHQKEYNETCDVWSLGCLFHELITGNQLFCGESIKQIYQQIISFEKYDHKSKWSDIIQKCLEVDIQKRISSQELQNLLQSEYDNNSNQNKRRESQCVQSNYSSLISTRKICTFYDTQSMLDQLEELPSQPQQEQEQLELQQQQNKHPSNNTLTYINLYGCNSNQQTYQIFSDERRNDTLILNEGNIVPLQFQYIDQKELSNKQKNQLSKIIGEYGEIEEEKQQDNIKSQHIQKQQSFQKSFIEQIDQKYSQQNLWNDLSNCENKYFFTSSLKNIQIFYYPKITKEIMPFKTKQYVDQETFHYSLFHLIIIIQFLKMFQMSNQQVDKELNDECTSSLKKLIVDIYNLRDKQGFKDIGKKNLLRLLCGLSELVQEKPLKIVIQYYQQFLKFKSFKKTMKALGKCFLESKTECQNVFSISNFQKYKNNQQTNKKIDEITYETENNKKFQIILNEFQYQIFQQMRKFIQFPDIQIQQIND